MSYGCNMFSHWTSTDADNCSDAKKWKFWLLMKLTSLPHIYIIQSTRFACWSDKRTKQEDFSPFYWVFPCLSNIYNAYCATKFSQTVNHWSLVISMAYSSRICKQHWQEIVRDSVSLDQTPSALYGLCVLDNLLCKHCDSQFAYMKSKLYTGYMAPGYMARHTCLYSQYDMAT